MTLTSFQMFFAILFVQFYFFQFQVHVQVLNAFCPLRRYILLFAFLYIFCFAVTVSASAHLIFCYHFLEQIYSFFILLNYNVEYLTPS